MMHKLLASIAEALGAGTDAADFAAGQIARLSVFHRAGVSVLASAFLLHARISGGAPYHRQPPENRLRIFRQWHHSALSPCRDFALLCSSLLNFARHDRAR